MSVGSTATVGLPSAAAGTGAGASTMSALAFAGGFSHTNCSRQARRRRWLALLPRRGQAARACVRVCVCACTHARVCLEYAFHTRCQPIFIIMQRIDPGFCGPSGNRTHSVASSAQLLSHCANARGKRERHCQCGKGAAAWCARASVRAVLVRGAAASVFKQLYNTILKLRRDCRRSTATELPSTLCRT